MIGDIFSFLDASLAWLLADQARLALWAALGGAASMLIYKFTSPQARIRELETAAVTARQALHRHEGEFADALPLMRANLSLALRRVKAAVVPSLLAGLPIIVCLIGLEPSYAKVQFAPIGPDWVRWWLTGYMLVCSASALGVKVALRIK